MSYDASVDHCTEGHAICAESRLGNRSIRIVDALEGEIQVMRNDDNVALIVILGDGTAVRTFLNSRQASYLRDALSGA